MNNTKPVVIDWWIGYMLHKSDREKEAYDKASSGGKKTFEGKELDLLGTYLGRKHGK